MAVKLIKCGGKIGKMAWLKVDKMWRYSGENVLVKG